MEDKQTLQDILETVNFIKDYAATKDDIQELRDETQEGFKEVRNEIIENVDSFIGLHRNMDIELSSVKSAVGRNETKILNVQKHLNIQ